MGAWIGGSAGWFFLLKGFHHSGVKKSVVVTQHNLWGWYYQMAMKREIRQQRLGDHPKITAIPGFWLNAKFTGSQSFKRKGADLHPGCPHPPRSTVLQCWQPEAAERTGYHQEVGGPVTTTQPAAWCHNRTSKGNDQQVSNVPTFPPAGYEIKSCQSSSFSPACREMRLLSFLHVTIKILKSLTGSYFPWAAAFKAVCLFFSYSTFL